MMKFFLPPTVIVFLILAFHALFYGHISNSYLFVSLSLFVGIISVFRQEGQRSWQYIVDLIMDSVLYGLFAGFIMTFVHAVISLLIPLFPSITLWRYYNDFVSGQMETMMKSWAIIAFLSFMVGLGAIVVRGFYGLLMDKKPSRSNLFV